MFDISQGEELTKQLRKLFPATADVEPTTLSECFAYLFQTQGSLRFWQDDDETTFYFKITFDGDEKEISRAIGKATAKAAQFNLLETEFIRAFRVLWRANHPDPHGNT